MLSIYSKPINANQGAFRYHLQNITTGTIVVASVVFYFFAVDLFGSVNAQAVFVPDFSLGVDYLAVPQAVHHRTFSVSTAK